MFTKKQYIILSILLLIGLSVSAKLFHIDYMVNYSGEPYKSFCNVNETFNCDAVSASEYSHLFGVPIAFIGLLSNLFLIIFVPISKRLSKLKDHIKEIYLFIFFFYAVGSISLAGISFFLINSFCFMCMAFWGASIACFVYVLVITPKSDIIPINLIKNVFKSIFAHKAVIFGLLFLYFGVMAGTRATLKSLSCPTEVNEQCQNYDNNENLAYFGTDQAKVSVTVYTDFQCPWCKRAHHHITELEKKFHNKVKFIRKDFPLDMACNPLVQRPFHNLACQSAYYAKCAGRQGKYWEYHDEVYNNQKNLSEETLINIGKLLALDINELVNCVNSSSIQNSVLDDINEALYYGISGTPVFIVFGEVLEGVINESQLNDYLERYPFLKAAVLKRIYDKASIKNIQLIDIREPAEFNKKHLQDAVNIPFSKIKSELDKLDRKKPVMIYGFEQLQTHDSFNILKSKGFAEIHILSGGIKKWQEDYGNLYLE